MSTFAIILLSSGFVGYARRVQLSANSLKGTTDPFGEAVSNSQRNGSMTAHRSFDTLKQLLFSFDPKVAQNLSGKFRSLPAHMNDDSNVSAARRGILSTILSMPFAAQSSLAKSPATSTKAPFVAYSVASAPLDRRSYRGLILSNGLRVLLASDPQAANAAASMTVQVGYMSDPVGFPGLAHFCEHMLFLGTKPFPTEGDFQRFVAFGGGSNNAFTAAEETNYFFDVEGGALKSALDRFAGFFTAPLFTASATSREVNAINSEHSKNLQNDFWRFNQLIKLWANQSHPYAKFGTGDRTTLREGDASARAALLEFHERYYQADQMSLALIGPQPLDFLQKLAVQKFAAIPSSDPPLPPSSAAYDDLSVPFQPSNKAPEALLMVPVNEQRTLKLRWCIPITDLDEWLASKPQDVWSLLLSNAAKGGLLPLLKRQGLALGLVAYTEEVTRTWMLLAVDIELEPLGLTKWRDVVSLLFAYLRKLCDAGVPHTFLEEFRALAKIGFDYAEPGQPQQWAMDASGNLPFYRPEQWVTGTALVTEGSEIGAAYLLEKCADPSNAIIILVASENEGQATSIEPIYGTQYGTVSLAREINSWRKASIPSDFAPPDPNPFIPTEFDIKCASGGRVCIPPKNDGSLRPQVLSDSEGLRVHFLQDSAFNRPKALAIFSFLSPLFVSSPKDTVIASLFTSVLSDVLQDSTFQARLAGMSVSVSASFNGLGLKASGYNSRLPEFVSAVSGEIRTAELTARAFDRQREATRQQLANFKLSQPISLCSYYRNLAILTLSYTNEELVEAVDKAVLSDVVNLQKSLLPETYLETFLAGNLEESEAREIVESVQKALPSSAPLPADSIPRRQVKEFEAGARYLQQFVASNPAEDNSAVEVYLQIGLDDGDTWLLLGLLANLMQEPFYGELRTKQQLGYIVQCGVDENEGVRALLLSVQSNVLAPPEVEERIDTFLEQYRKELASLSSSEFNKYRKSLALQVIDVDKRLDSQANRLWTEITKRRYDYSRPWRVRDRLRSITKKHLLAFYDRFIIPGAPDRRQLSSHVFASRTAPVELIVDSLPERFYPRPPEGSLENGIV